METKIDIVLNRQIDGQTFKAFHEYGRLRLKSDEVQILQYCNVISIFKTFPISNCPNFICEGENKQLDSSL